LIFERNKMARDKSKDDNLFNCSQDYEHDHVVRQYPKEYQDKIRDFLKKACQNKKIYHSKHKEVYDLIEKELGYFTD
ncbi:TPA: hypothetical protein ACW4KA_001942, partial [Campylobacter jejuni]